MHPQIAAPDGVAIFFWPSQEFRRNLELVSKCGVLKTERMSGPVRPSPFDTPNWVSAQPSHPSKVPSGPAGRARVRPPGGSLGACALRAADQYGAGRDRVRDHRVGECSALVFRALDIG